MKALAFSAALLAAAPALAQTPYLVKDILPGADGSRPTELVAVGNRVYFSARSSAAFGAAFELWASDGTDAGTYRVKAMPPKSILRRLTAFGEKVCFAAYTEAEGEEPWCSDGTESGTALVADLAEGSASSTPHAFRVFRGKLYFFARDASGNDKLWSTDGAQAGTTTIVGSYPFTPSSGPNLVATESALFFSASSEVSDRLWVSDGTAAGTVRLDTSPLHQRSEGVYRWGERVVFTAVGDQGDREPWVSDGTVAGTRLLRDIHPGGASQARSFFPLGERMLFTANDGQHGLELWQTDGTEQGTQLVRDINPGVGDGQPWAQAALNGYAYFPANDGVTGVELWRSNGTSAGTELVADIDQATTIGSLPRMLTPAGPYLYFTVSDVLLQRSLLFRTDGSAEGTAAVGRPSFQADVAGQPFALLGTTLFVVATTPDQGTELWALPNAFTVASEADVSVSALAVRSVGARSVELTTPAGSVRVEAFDLLGRRVATLHDGDAPSTLRLALPPGLGVGAYVVWATAATGETASALVRAR